MTDKTSVYPVDKNKILKGITFFHTVYWISLASNKMGKYHENLIEDKPSGGHMGWAVAYLTKGTSMIKNA